MAKENKTKNYCGVKFETRIALNKFQREVIDTAGKRHHMVTIILPKNQDSFIVVFENRLHRDGFVTAITPQLYGDIKYSYVNEIKMESK